jgi:hypothetical protein
MPLWPLAQFVLWHRQRRLRRPATSPLATTRRLIALCPSQPDDPLYAEALQFCYGYMAGVAQLPRVLVQADDIEPVACPDTK